MVLVNGLVALDAHKVLGSGELAVEVGSIDHHFLVLSEAASGFLHNAECHGKHLGEGFFHIVERQLVEFVYLVEDGLALVDWRVFNLGLELCYLNDGYRPGGYTSYERHFMGWMDLIDPVENTRYVMEPLNTDGGTAVKVTNDANPDEYYLLEYRVKTGWDEYLPAEGIMILHVDYDKDAWDNNTPNNNSSHPRMTIIPADNRLSGSTNYTDLWPLGELDSLTNNSTPAATVYTGEFMNKPLTGMTVDSQNQTAAFWYMKSSLLPGDVNRDGEVNISDISVLIDMILGGVQSPDGDVNGDGEVNITDISDIIDIILAQ